MSYTSTSSSTPTTRSQSVRSSEKDRGPCPKCNGKDSFVEYHNGRARCYRCDYIVRAVDSVSQSKRRKARANEKPPIDIVVEWRKAMPVLGQDHPYLRRKGGLTGFGLRKRKRRLVVPLCDIEGQLTSLQFIRGHGQKRLARGHSLGDSFFSVGKNPEKQIFMCEGVADALTLYQVLHCYTAAAISAGRLERVARVHRDAYPDTEIVIVGDNDEK